MQQGLSHLGVRAAILQPDMRLYATPKNKILGVFVIFFTFFWLTAESESGEELVFHPSPSHLFVLILKLRLNKG